MALPMEMVAWGRMLYAIAELRNDSFNPLAMDAENSLHGIK